VTFFVPSPQPAWNKQVGSWDSLGLPVALHILYQNGHGQTHPWPFCFEEIGTRLRNE
jgi:hypothetical protein